MDKKIEHLKMIQAIIIRMANNSFMLKGWGVVLASAIFALLAKDVNKQFIFLTILPVIAFWILDGYYLRQERLFRKLYDQVRLKNESEIDFSMDTSSVKNQVKGWFFVCFSRTIFFVYGTILLLVIILAL
ncbi:MAG: hypothetical protein AAB116_21360, partial [Candidatus Poribacteria bacterium]